jgi:competence protein ComFC
LAHPQLDRELNLIYFFHYRDLEPILKTKYHPFGNRILEAVAKRILGKIEVNPFPFPVVGIPIDPVPYRGFSHTAILARHLPFPVTYGLIEKNRVQYSGQSFEFRLKNLRQFIYTGPSHIRGVLIDDVATTGLTLKVATQKLEEHQVEVVGAITLARG